MHKIFSHFLITLTTFLITLNSCTTNQEKSKNKVTSTKINEVNQYVEGIMERIGIPGAGVAILKNGKTIHENYYGLANIEHQVPVESKTIFPLLSTSKIPVITAVFKLIEENKISLDDNIGKFIDDIPEQWKNIEVRYLLAHSSGLPDVRDYDKVDEETMKKSVYDDPFEFEKGDIFSYNQTNYWILARIIAKITGEEFESHLLKEQFEKENPYILFSTNMLEIIPNRATRYTTWNDRNTFEVDKQINGSHLNSCNGLNISLPEFINWSKKFEQGKFINKSSKEEMWNKFDFTKGGPDFAYGWEIHNINNHLSYGFSGGNTTSFRIFPEDSLTIIWLTNGFEKSYSKDPIINYIAGVVDKELQNDKSLANEKVSQLFYKNDIDHALNGYKKIKSKYPKIDLCPKLFSIAESYFNDDQIEKSISISNLMVTEYPKNWMGYYWRANANKKLKNYPQAILDYRKSAELSESESDKIQLNKMAENLEMKVKKN